MAAQTKVAASAYSKLVHFSTVLTEWGGDQGGKYVCHLYTD